MKPIGFWWDAWDGAIRSGSEFIVEMQAAEGKTIQAGGHSSSSIWAAVPPVKADGSPIDQAWADGLLAGEPNFEHFIRPIEGEIGAFAVQAGVKLIFADERIQTINGYPQTHLRGPATLNEQ